MTDETPQPRADGQQPTVEKGGLWGVFLAAVGLMWPPFGMPFSLIGIVQGRRARKAARANKGQAPGAVLSMVLGWVGLVVSVFAIAGYAVFWNEYTAYRDCSARALTVSAQQDCDDAWRADVAERAGIPEKEVPALGS
ncbi:DUF4190 domain-containing protein [Nocardiopsis composta]|uniref:DUF4190 domain-containing protein n=1 Tax=Nocardiopsis composta TaxID=157465 RepID=A0A7W8QM25_9ACTN|nr:DUF4190 domain-containing protein [Nocardiopsis composta]MBB5432958.1 hypothetical protein [Nocardiopsis composta]HLU97315.1 DUF4190 domain-containing protein [Thermobifida alba]